MASCFGVWAAGKLAVILPSFFSRSIYWKLLRMLPGKRLSQPPVFSSPFFIGCGGVTVEDAGPGAALAVGFQGGRVGELGAVVGKQHGHEPFETVRAQLCRSQTASRCSPLGMRASAPSSRNGWSAAPSRPWCPRQNPAG